MKKNPAAFNDLQVEYFKTVEEKHLSMKLCSYVWNVLVCMSKGYGFNAAHTLAYSIVGLQEANLAYHYPIIYWNCANLISDSGGEDGNTNYGKIATAISNIQKAGAVVALPDINKAKFGFYPDADNNVIIYGLKPIQGIGAKVAKAIVDNRPYNSMEEFYDKMQHYKAESDDAKFGDVAMITLIKAGCFDNLENRSRMDIMADFIRLLSKPVKNLKVGNIEALNDMGMLTEAQKKYELRLFRFRKYLYQPKFFVKQTGKSATTAYYKLDRKFAEPYFYENFETNMVEGKDYEYTDDGFIAVKRGSLDREFDKLMSDFKNNVLNNKNNLKAFNDYRFKTEWNDKVPGNISKWEMDSLCYYYHEHELAHVNKDLYNIVNFNELSPEAEVSDTYEWRGRTMYRFNLCRICGTVLDRNKDKSLVTLLTPDGVVDVKFYKGQFGFYDKQISEVKADGTKERLEKSWFSRGSKLLITGYRRDEQFIPKHYNDSIYKHSVQLIEEINDDGTLILKSERVDVNNNEE